jgi:natural product biosynthesis luciferase-like monooxygenase protein
MGYLRDRLQGLSPERRRILEQRLRSKGLHLPPSGDAAGSEPEARRKTMGFSLFYFAGDGASTEPDRYRLMLETVRFADLRGFDAVWTPERHFQQFGGLYPNPSVLGAALAMITRRLQIRAGSVVLPLHHPIRVAEEWAVVDNLSGGRVAISVATGWHPGDFVLAPRCFEDRKDIALSHIKSIQRLWCGQPVEFPDIRGNQVPVRILPKPVQPRLPIFLTASGNPATWVQAGEMGAGVLCALISQSSSDLAKRIASYRATLARNHQDPALGRVAVMLHTFIGSDDENVRARVMAPLREYLGTFIGQYDYLNALRGEFPQADQMGDGERAELIEFACERYYQSNSLMGTFAKCRAMVDSLADMGVDEVACLVDFGLNLDTVMESLERLARLRESYQRPRMTETVGGGQ